MKLPVRLPVLPSQSYSAGGDVELDGRNGHGAAGSREPLRESTGNAQHNPIQAQSVYPIPGLPEKLSGPVSTPSYFAQTIDFFHGGAQYARSFLHQAQAQLQIQSGRRGLGRNPFWVSPEFQAYRKRQNERDDKAGQKWPDLLEEAFLDAFLLMPQIGKSKYSIGGKPYGRNMLIGKYIDLYYAASLPPGAILDPSMSRGRKQVSSHIQVLKNFLKYHPWFHIFFPNYETKRTKDKDRENQAKESFKNHPVLIALTEQRLPDEIPNYEYFKQILAMKNAIAIKPKRCWIFVSHRDVSVQEDGSGVLATSGDRLPSGEYPHLKLNLEREKWAKEEQQQIFKGSLLHEFTKDLSQFEASSVREISDEWEETCPELHEQLEDITATNPRCDIFHMHSTLELKGGRQFPGHSDLNSWVEIVVEQPQLLNHRWKVETTLMRPPELGYSGEKSAPETVYRTSAKMGIQYQHRPGCDGHRGSGGDTCDARCRRDCVIVPFPADVFAVTLTNCAEYPAHPPTEVIKRGKKTVTVVKTEVGDRDRDSKTSGGDQPTQMDLVPRIAMMQELWSCPPDEGSSLYGDDPQGREDKKGVRWERRGLLLWTFQTLHSTDYPSSKDEAPELKTAPNGKTQWRFLQILDTSSQYHLQRVLVKGDGAARFRDGPGNRASSFNSSGKLDSCPPSPMTSTYQQQPRSASTTESFSAAGWDVHGGNMHSLSSSATQVRNAHAHAQAAYNTQLMLQTQAAGMLGGFGGTTGSGLATPPPSASLASSFATSFENVGNDGADQLTNYMAAHGTSASDMAAVHSQQALADLAAVTDPFLANSAGSSFDTGAFDEAGAHDDVSGWASSGGTVPGANGWSTGYSTTANGNQHHPAGAAVMHWAHGSPSAATAGSNETLRHYSQQEHISTQPPQLHLQTQGHHHSHNHQHPHHWLTSTTADSEETGFWTPATSNDDALTSGIDGREQLIWPLSAPRIPNSTNHHDQAHTHRDDWVHVDHSSAGTVGSADEVIVREEEDEDEEAALSAASELSEGWEEIVAAAAAAAASESQHHHQESQSQPQSQYNHSQSTIATDTQDQDDDDDFAASFPLSPLAAAAGHLQHMSNSFLESRGQKRSRSDDIRDDEYEYDLERMERRHIQRPRRGDETC
ncbi:regulatory protein abaA [Rhypophila decipiens]|uniref:Regulatory protein abaA n=1 Tax=Rhypophila decipiens TaxID=261697 RepID=A0AAN6YGG5_9PEZI|nr:regulatory protein abaA [Rhypophila decipiens]